MSKVFFKEEQHFTQPWIWVIIISSLTLVIIIFGSGINKQIIEGEPFGDNPISDVGLIIIASFNTLLMVGITLLFYKMKLITEIREDGVYYKFPIFITRFKLISKDEIDKFEVRTYKPIKEYGGWGIKTGNKKSGKAYNINGNIGLQLYLKNGKKILFGTSRKDAIHSAMNKLMNSL